MNFVVKPSALKGTATIPGSKSNTTRAVFIASMADGRSIIRNPLPSRDCISTVEVCRRFGASIEMGAKAEMDKDSLTIYQSDLKGTQIDGHTDHRIVMATTVAGLIAEGETEVTNAEYHKISFPNFYDVMTSLGADLDGVK